MGLSAPVCTAMPHLPMGCSRLKPACVQLINKSLTALGKVVNALAEGRAGSAQHIPYRRASQQAVC